MKYVTIIGFGSPTGDMQYASQGVWLENGRILGPGALAKVEEIPANLRNIIRQVSDDEVQEYIESGKNVLDATVPLEEVPLEEDEEEGDEE